MEENGAHFFEGTEKLLEVWFTRQDEAKGTGDLRTIPRWVTGRPGGAPLGLGWGDDLSSRCNHQGLTHP